jgi:hypothetical protein
MKDYKNNEHTFTKAKQGKGTSITAESYTVGLEIDEFKTRRGRQRLKRVTQQRNVIIQ